MKIVALSQSLTPITHQLGTVGNESIVNTEDVATPLGLRKVPVLTGNAIRHRVVRAPAADAFVEVAGLSGKLSRDQLNLLYHGGLKREKNKKPSLKRIADFQRLFPVFDLLGACLPEAIVAGRMNVWRAILCCRENQSRIESLSGESIEMTLPPASHYVSRWQYVRGKLDHRAAEAATDTTDEDDSKMMPFAGTCVVSGAWWMHGFDIPNEPLLIGCLLNSIERWEAEGGTIGGQSSRGHGRLALSLVSDGAFDSQDCMTLYRDHLAVNVAEATELLFTC
jgi:hypothetical protein